MTDEAVLPAPVEARSLFAVPDYRRLWAAGALTGCARWLEFIAIGIFAFELTRSPPLVALLAVLRMMPYVALGFFVGALADRIDRRRLLIFSTAIATASAATMCALTTLQLAGYAAVALATMVSGAFWTIDMPVRRRLLADIAGPSRLAQALGFDNSTNYATRAIGPLIGGLTYQLLGIEGIYGLIAAAYASCLALAIALTRRTPSETGNRVSTRVLDALRVPRSLLLDRRFLVIMGVTLVYNLFCFPFTSMVPVIAQKDFLLIPVLVGALSACEGVGGTLGAVLAGVLGSERTLFRTYFFGTLSLLLLMLGLSLHLEVRTAVPALILIGGSAACFSATQYALVHVISPPEVRGRATGVLSLFIGSSMFGHYIAGQLFGGLPSPLAIRTMAISGIALMVALGLLWRRAGPPPVRSA